MKFVDRTFNVNHARTKELLRFIKEHDNGITNFHFEISADLLDDEEIGLLNSLQAGSGAAGDRRPVHRRSRC